MKSEIIKDLQELQKLGSGVHIKKTLKKIECGDFDETIQECDESGCRVSEASDLLISLTF